MPTYSYRCAECGPFEVRRPIGEAGPTDECACGRAATRLYTPPSLARTPAALAGALGAAEASAHEPAVAGRPPGNAHRRASAAPDPRWSRLPRP